MEIKFIKYFETKFKEQLHGLIRAGLNTSNLGTTSYGTEKAVDDITVGVHSDFSYNIENDIEIYVKQLTGSIINGIVQVPFQIIVNTNSQFAELVRNTLDKLAVELNESIAKDEDNKSFKIILSTSVVVQSFLNDGVNERSILSQNVNIFVIEYLQDLEAMAIDNEVVKFNNFVFSHIGSGDSTGALFNNNGVAKEVVNTIVNTISFTTPIIDSDFCTNVISQINDQLSKNYKYHVILDVGKYTIIKEYVLVNANITKDYNTFASLSVTLREA